MKIWPGYFIISIFFFFGCNISSEKSNLRQTSVYISISTARNEKAYLIKTPYNNEKRTVADSQIIISAKDTIIFTIPFEPDRQYEIEISGSHRTFNFIPDAKEIYVAFNNINGNCIINGSTASISLENFKQAQSVLADSIAAINKGTQLSKKDKATIAASLAKIINQNNYNYADTVSNAAAFIDVSGAINFNKNFNELRSLTERAVKRFPKSAEVLLIRKQSLDMIDIYEKEYLPGEILPSVSLPDNNGILFSTSSLKGNYYLINFWASWYPKTYPYIQASENVLNTYVPGNLKIVNIALDDDKENWNRIIRTSHSKAINLIDTAMWHGTAANTLKFDSIPFNFLVDKNGVIIDKAIRPDSLAFILRQKVH